MEREPLYVWLNDNDDTEVFNGLPFILYRHSGMPAGHLREEAFHTVRNLRDFVKQNNFGIIYQVPKELKHIQTYRPPTRGEIVLMETLMLLDQPSHTDYFALREELYDKPQTYGQALFKLRDLTRPESAH